MSGSAAKLAMRKTQTQRGHPSGMASYSSALDLRLRTVPSSIAHPGSLDTPAIVRGTLDPGSVRCGSGHLLTHTLGLLRGCGCRTLQFGSGTLRIAMHGVEHLSRPISAA